jgi:hypothetical protein
VCVKDMCKYCSVMNLIMDLDFVNVAMNLQNLYKKSKEYPDQLSKCQLFK